MNSDSQNRSSQAEITSNKKGKNILIKLLLCLISVFLLLFIMNYLVKKEVYSLLETHQISPQIKSSDHNSNP